MNWLHRLDKILPRGGVQTTTELVDIVRDKYKLAMTKATIDVIQRNGKCQYCTTPYEDGVVSCIKCGAPRE